jgi:hypothetical protein
MLNNRPIAPRRAARSCFRLVGRFGLRRDVALPRGLQIRRIDAEHFERAASSGREDRGRDPAIDRKREALDQLLVGRNAVATGRKQAIDALERERPGEMSTSCRACAWSWLSNVPGAELVGALASAGIEPRGCAQIRIAMGVESPSMAGLIRRQRGMDRASASTVTKNDHSIALS